MEPQKAYRGRLEIVSKKNTPKSNFSILIAEQQLSDIQVPQVNTNDKDTIEGTNIVTQVINIYIYIQCLENCFTYTRYRHI